jgi:hypothetical protein
MIDLLIVIITLLGLIVGSITDLKKREIPDWISYGLMFSGLGLRLIYSVATLDWMYFLSGLIWFGILFGLACLMFYTGQWGGGDSKLLIGIGALFATYPKFMYNYFQPMFFFYFSPLIAFWLNLLLVGAAYAILWSIVVGIINFKKFKIKFTEKLKHETLTKIRHIIFVVSSFMVGLGFFMQDLFLKLILIIFGMLFVLFYYSWIYIKSVEESCMQKAVHPKDLTEGDWIVEDIIVNEKTICGPKSLGIEKKQIEELIELYNKNKIDKVVIKVGIPFIPSFLFAYIITIIIGNIVFLII